MTQPAKASPPSFLLFPPSSPPRNSLVGVLELGRKDFIFHKLPPIPDVFCPISAEQKLPVRTDTQTGIFSSPPWSLPAQSEGLSREKWTT